ncbi:hypothetical protein HMPREF0742_02108 [Rothia aeria F0184]|uniref:Uncharacterized protein n=1 Tax=Rothia aeria F0184 TaxID=888019 RepID=U7V3E5_9MICC|nr:hypothetical protein HMPREF0742_02108 [Rothia aeria F0184]
MIPQKANKYSLKFLANIFTQHAFRMTSKLWRYIIYLFNVWCSVVYANCTRASV